MSEPIANSEIQIGVEATPTVESYFKLLKKEEAKLADLNEEIPVGTITSADSEYQKLLESGVTPQELESRKIKREKLLKAGFIFNNQPIFPIEKPLINIELDGVNYGQRKLLTGEELEKIKIYQREHPREYGTDIISTDEFRTDMLSLLLTAEDNLTGHIKRKVNFYRLAIHQMDNYTYGGDGAEAKLAHSYKELVEMQAKDIAKDDHYHNQENFIKENLSDVMPWEETQKTNRFDISARGQKMMLIETRRGKLNGLPSPFLDSGFHFPSYIANPDYTVIGSNGKLFRVNSLVLHLASRGISEMGDNKRGDGEQDYSIGNYVRDLYVVDPQKRVQVHKGEDIKFKMKLDFNEEEVTRKVQDKLKVLALNWADRTNSPIEAKQLADRIRKTEQNQGKGIFSRLSNRFKSS